mgnify:CR=1 FL=1
MDHVVHMAVLVIIHPACGQLVEYGIVFPGGRRGTWHLSLFFLRVSANLKEATKITVSVKS